MAKAVYKGDWEKYLNGMNPPGKSTIVVIRKRLDDPNAPPTSVATNFLSDPRHPGVYTMRTRLKNDPKQMVLERIVTFWISDPDVAFEFKLRFG